MLWYLYKVAFLDPASISALTTYRIDLDLTGLGRNLRQDGSSIQLDVCFCGRLWKHPVWI